MTFWSCVVVQSCISVGGQARIVARANFSTSCPLVLPYGSRTDVGGEREVFVSAAVENCGTLTFVGTGPVVLSGEIRNNGTVSVSAVALGGVTLRSRVSYRFALLSVPLKKGLTAFAQLWNGGVFSVDAPCLLEREGVFDVCPVINAAFSVRGSITGACRNLVVPPARTIRLMPSEGWIVVEPAISLGSGAAMFKLGSGTVLLRSGVESWGSIAVLEGRAEFATQVTCNGSISIAGGATAVLRSSVYGGGTVLVREGRLVIEVPDENISVVGTVVVDSSGAAEVVGTGTVQFSSKAGLPFGAIRNNCCVH